MQRFIHIPKYTHNFLTDILLSYTFVVSDLLKTDYHFYYYYFYY